MSRFTSLKRLAFAALATAGVIAACRAAQPGEAPPLAPRPEIGPSNPVPGAPDLLDSPEPGTPGPNTPRHDAGAAPVTPTNPGPISQVDPPIYRSADGTVLPETPLQAPTDAGPGGRDAARPDAQRRDAALPDAPADAAARDAAPDAPAPDPGPRDAGVPDARDGGVGLPPVPDASFPPDAVRPM